MSPFYVGRMSPFDIGLDVSVSCRPGCFRFIQALMSRFDIGMDVSIWYTPGCLHFM